MKGPWSWKIIFNRFNKWKKKHLMQAVTYVLRPVQFSKPIAHHLLEIAPVFLPLIF